MMIIVVMMHPVDSMINIILYSAHGSVNGRTPDALHEDRALPSQGHGQPTPTWSAPRRGGRFRRRVGSVVGSDQRRLGHDRAAIQRVHAGNTGRSPGRSSAADGGARASPPALWNRPRPWPAAAS